MLLANGHLYIATNEKLPRAYADDDFKRLVKIFHLDLAADSRFQTIWYYAALNGHRFGVIPVLAEAGDRDEDDQELEGICYADVATKAGIRVQIHAVLLDNHDIALDNIYFKSFGAEDPNVV